MNDLRLALRGLVRAPGFACLAIVTLALGIGASTAIFSVVNGVLLRSLPYPEPDSLMQVETVFASGNTGRLSYPDFEDLRAENGSFAELAAYSAWTTTAADAGQGFRVGWALVSDGFFTVVGSEPALGRTFTAEEERTGGPAAIVSYGYWSSRLNASRDLVDQRVRVGDRVYTVVGVMPRGYDFPAGTDLWVPREPATESRTAHNWSVVGRRRDGVSGVLAQQDLSAIARRLEQRYGDDTDMRNVAVRPVLEQLVGNVRPALSILLGAASVLLLVACANVGNLLLARAFSRDRESALRLALGARPARLARAFLAESLVLALAAAALGTLIAFAGVPALLALEPGRLPRIENVGVDGAVLAFALIASVLVALAIGLVPAARAARSDTREALAGSHRIHGRSRASHRLRAALVASQIALTIVLLVGAGLIGRSLSQLLAVDPGFRTDGALIVDVWQPDPRDAAAEAQVAAFLAGLEAGLRAIPGVEQVGGVNRFPLRGGGANGTFVILERPDEIANFDDFSQLANEPTRAGNAEFRVAGAGYFGTMGVPLIRGRLFDERDTREAPHVALISESLAAARWPDEDPLGKLIQFGNMDGDLRPFTIVGIVGDVREYGIGARSRPTFYADYRQRPGKAAQFHVAIEGPADVAALAAAVRRAAQAIDASVPTGVVPLRDVVSESLADRQFVLVLLALFGAVALALTTMGAYGVIAYLALQRTSEMGVRIALGASRHHVTALLVRQGVVVAAAGIVIGLIAALALTRLIARFLYGVGANDPVTFALTAVVLLGTAVVASWVPAHRAARTDPLEALRHE